MDPCSTRKWKDSGKRAGIVCREIICFEHPVCQQDNKSPIDYCASVQIHQLMMYTYYRRTRRTVSQSVSLLLPTYSWPIIYLELHIRPTVRLIREACSFVFARHINWTKIICLFFIFQMYNSLLDILKEKRIKFHVCGSLAPKRAKRCQRASSRGFESCSCLVVVSISNRLWFPLRLREKPDGGTIDNNLPS